MAACAGATPEPSPAPSPTSSPGGAALESTASPEPTSAPSAASLAASSSATPPPEAPPPVNAEPSSNRFAAAYGAPPAYGPGAAPATTAPATAATAATDRVALGTIAVSGGAIDNADTVVAAMQGAFSRCYDKSIEANPNAKGEVAITIRVGLAGQVLGVTGHRSEAVPASLMACLTTNAATADFHPPTGAKTAATVAFPVTIGRR